jgi:hypothetical protein
VNTSTIPSEALRETVLRLTGANGLGLLREESLAPNDGALPLDRIAMRTRLCHELIFPTRSPRQNPHVARHGPPLELSMPGTNGRLFPEQQEVLGIHEIPVAR